MLVLDSARGPDLRKRRSSARQIAVANDQQPSLSLQHFNRLGRALSHAVEALRQRRDFIVA